MTILWHKSSHNFAGILISLWSNLRSTIVRLKSTWFLEFLDTREPNYAYEGMICLHSHQQYKKGERNCLERRQISDSEEEYYDLEFHQRYWRMGWVHFSQLSFWKGILILNWARLPIFPWDHSLLGMVSYVAVTGISLVFAHL